MKQERARFIFTTAIVLVVIATLFYLVSKREGGSDLDPKRPQSVSLALGKNVWDSLPIVASEKGFFEEQGLNVSLSFQDAGRYCMDALISGSADFAAIVEANVAYVGFTGTDKPVVLSGIVSSSCGIVARKSSGIESVSDLEGTRVAYTAATGAEPYLYRLLEKNNVELSSLELRKMHPKAIQPALLTGDIDAASTWEPFIYNIKSFLGEDAIEFRDPTAFTGHMMLASGRQFAVKNTDAVGAMLRALRQAEEFIVANPLESQKLLAEYLSVDLETIQGIWPNFNMKLHMDQDALIEAVNYVGRNAIATDEAFSQKELPDYRGYFDRSYFDSAFPQ